MIVDVDAMISLIRDFVVTSNDKAMVVGGIAGTEIERFAIEGITEVHDFNKVLIVQCCQDYMGIMKNPIPNVKFVGDLLLPRILDHPFKHINPFKPRIENPDVKFGMELNFDMINKYNAIVILNAHLMNERMATDLMENGPGPQIYVVDPIEDRYWSRMTFHCEDIPVITDTLLKVSPMIAMARDLVGADTRAINNKIKCNLNQVSKMSRRTVGKIDDKQYVTGDYDLLNDIMKKQEESPFRKNQKVIVRGIIDVMVDDSNNRQTLVHGSMLVVHNAGSKPLMRMRLWNSKIIYATNICYSHNYNRYLGGRTDVIVDPANIMNTFDFIRHRYQHSVFINTENHKCDKVEMYSLLKNSNNVTIVENCK